MSEKPNSQNINVSRFSVSLKIVIGIILISFVAVASFISIGFISFISKNIFLLSDGLLYIFFICFTISLFVSFVYFSFQKFQKKLLITTHLMGTVVFLAFFIFQFINVRTNQALVLNTYQQFGRAVEQGSFEYAYQLMSSDYRQVNTVDDLANDDYFLPYAQEEINTMYAVDYNFWNNQASITVDAWPSPTFWHRASDGVALDFEFIDGQWLLTGTYQIYFLH